MIHSLAGGVVRDIEYNDFAKVKIIDPKGRFGEIYWYISTIKDLKQSDTVLVPVGVNNDQFLGEVQRVDKNVSSQTAPVPIKRCKKIIKVVK